jgi:polyhydroxybutyrate depolymerase
LRIRSLGWAMREGCSDVAAESYKNGVASCKTHSACAEGVELTLCTIDGGGHCWPGTQICPHGERTTDISANTFGWNFMKRFGLP